VNFLAHLYLAGPEDDALVGNFLGDFVKGPLVEAPARYRAGIGMHRAVDSYTDDHEVTRRSRERIRPERRRFAGIIVDMCYDHFLARDWPLYSTERLPAFSLRVYELLEARRDHMPDRVRTALPHMRRDDWLYSYREVEGIGRALDGLSRRRTRLAALSGGSEELVANYAGLEADFQAFFPDLEAFVAAYEPG
jgi:acyl carrier protein phosphodiesterase